MIVKIFSRGSGGGSSPIDYLCGKSHGEGAREVTREGAQILAGDADLTEQLINSAQFSRKYTAGVLSFAEQAKDVTDAQKAEIMERFEECMFAGLEGNQYNILWVQHEDKGGRLELNFLVPNVELTTGKRLQPYYDRVDRGRFNAFKDMVNYEHGFADPNDPDRKRNLVTAKDLPRDKKEAVEAITRGLESLVAQGTISDRQGIVQALEGTGFEIARQTKSSISIKDPEGGKNIRLKGAIYEQDFRASKDLRAEREGASEKYRTTARERYATASREYQERLRSAAERNKKAYRGDNNRSTERQSEGAQNVSLSSHTDKPITTPFNFLGASNSLRLDGLPAERNEERRHRNGEEHRSHERARGDGENIELPNGGRKETATVRRSSDGQSMGEQNKRFGIQATTQEIRRDDDPVRETIARSIKEAGERNRRARETLKRTRITLGSFIEERQRRFRTLAERARTAIGALAKLSRAIDRALEEKRQETQNKRRGRGFSR